MDHNKWPVRRFLSQKPPWYLWLAVGALILGSILISLSNVNDKSLGQAEKPAGPTASQLAREQQERELMTTARELEEQLQGILAKVAGAGRVAVRVSLAASPLKEFATNTKTTKHSVEEKDQSGGSRVTTDVNEDAQLVMARNSQLSSGEVPVVVRESKPEVQGVVVVADGASNPRVRASFIQAVETLWGLSPHQVQVLPMEPGGSHK